MSDKYNVVYSPESTDDLRSIYSYIAFELNAPNTAESQVNRIRKEIRSLDFMPLRYTLVDWEPWQSMKTHERSIDNFVIYYLSIPILLLLQSSVSFMADGIYEMSSDHNLNNRKRNGCDHRSFSMLFAFFFQYRFSLSYACFFHQCQRLSGGATKY